MSQVAILGVVWIVCGFLGGRAILTIFRREGGPIKDADRAMAAACGVIGGPIFLLIAGTGLLLTSDYSMSGWLRNVLRRAFP